MFRPGLYIHVPFCQSKCNYCNFYSIKPNGNLPEYIHAILEELSLYSDEFSVFDSIYIGGGTPSLLSPEAFSEILNHARKIFRIANNAETTVEINPADASLHFLTALRQTGVNRLNIGIQSFDVNILRFLNRRHNTGQAVQSIEQARMAGFDNIGLDFIYGIPSQSIQSWKETLSQALSFHPEHLSCYQLTLENETPLGRRHQKGEFTLPDEDKQAEFFMTTSDMLEAAGYQHYEISNFARNDGFRSRHNQKYWQHIPYLGIGPAAHSLSGNRRWWNHRSVEKYLIDVRKGKRPVEGSESLTPSQKRLETVFLGLRTSEGIALKHFAEGDDAFSSQQDKEKTLDDLVQQGLVVIRDGFIKPTRRGLAMADRLALIL